MWLLIFLLYLLIGLAISFSIERSAKSDLVEEMRTDISSEILYNNYWIIHIITMAIWPFSLVGYIIHETKDIV